MKLIFNSLVKMRSFLVDSHTQIHTNYNPYKTIGLKLKLYGSKLKFNHILSNDINPYSN